jgi:hypothetical protein
MSALHGKEDSLLEPVRFAKLLRQANDAEIADVRMIGEDRYEISPHKADLALQMQARPVAEQAAGTSSDAAPATAAAPTIRFRGNARSATRPLQMVGVIDLNTGTHKAPAPAPASPAPVVPAAAVAAAAVAADTTAPKGRAKRAPAKPKSSVAAPVVAAPKAAAPAAKGAKVAKAAKTAKAAKKSTPSAPATSKPRSR